MLDREVVKEFLKDQFKKIGIKIPQEIKESDLVEAFCLYVEEDYYEWLKDNFRGFFFSIPHNNPDWEWIKEGIEYCLKQN